jgi:hypothetical protein
VHRIFGEELLACNKQKNGDVADSPIDRILILSNVQISAFRVSPLLRGPKLGKKSASHSGGICRNAASTLSMVATGPATGTGDNRMTDTGFSLPLVKKVRYECRSFDRSAHQGCIFFSSFVHLAGANLHAGILVTTMHRLTRTVPRRLRSLMAPGTNT